MSDTAEESHSEFFEAGLKLLREDGRFYFMNDVQLWGIHGHAVCVDETYGFTIHEPKYGIGGVNTIGPMLGSSRTLNGAIELIRSGCTTVEALLKELR